MTQPRPFVSVIMPMRNEGRFIADCLQSLLRCSYPAHCWEIILVDGMSEDNTREEVARLSADARVPITLLENPRKVTPFALNIALGCARGSMVIRVDAHSIYGEEYVSRCVKVLEDTGAANVGGIMVARPGAETPMGRAIALAMMHPFGVGNSMLRIATSAQEVDSVPFGCFRTEIFQRVGLFDERLVRNQDFELNQRIRRAGGRIYLDPQLELRYFSRPTLRSLLRQTWSNGFWNALCHHLHPYSRCFRHVVPIFFTLGAVGAFAFALYTTLASLPSGLLPMAVALWTLYSLYLVVNFAVATALSRRHGWRLWPSLVILFPAFHFVNGAGLVVGWLRALTRRYPWQPQDHCPSWQEQREGRDTRLAA